MRAVTSEGKSKPLFSVETRQLVFQNHFAVLIYLNFSNDNEKELTFLILSWRVFKLSVHETRTLKAGRTRFSETFAKWALIVTAVKNYNKIKSDISSIAGR